MDLYDSRVEAAHLKVALEAVCPQAEVNRAQMLEVADDYLKGYEEALLYVRTLFPDLDRQHCKPYMRVKGSRLVDSTKEAHAGILKGTLGIEVGRAEESVADDVELRAE